MAWTTPRTWAAREKVTAANMNTYVSDNLTMLGNGPFCDLYSTTPGNTSGSVDTFTAVPFDGETDVFNMHDTSTNTGRITIATAGLYLVSGGAGIAQQAAAVRFAVCIYLNGSNVSSTYASAYVPTAPSGHYGTTTSRIIRLAAADYIELRVSCSAASVALASTSASRPWFQARWIGA